MWNWVSGKIKFKLFDELILFIPPGKICLKGLQENLRCGYRQGAFQIFAGG